MVRGYILNYIYIYIYNSECLYQARGYIYIYQVKSVKRYWIINLQILEHVQLPNTLNKISFQRAAKHHSTSVILTLATSKVVIKAENKAIALERIWLIKLALKEQSGLLLGSPFRRELHANRDFSCSLNLYILASKAGWPPLAHLYRHTTAGRNSSGNAIWIFFTHSHPTRTGRRIFVWIIHPASAVLFKYWAVTQFEKERPAALTIWRPSRIETCTINKRTQPFSRSLLMTLIGWPLLHHPCVNQTGMREWILCNAYTKLMQ